MVAQPPQPVGEASEPWLLQRAEAAAVTAVALAARLLVVAWAACRIPPTADGEYYHRLATRLASGLGYTWLWPDGAVTYAAHYPVGYPAAVGALYAVVGPEPVAAMLFNAALGALGALAVHQLVARSSPGDRRAALLGGLLVAVHPGLVAYTPALMTEGVTAALVACAAWVAALARGSRSVGGAAALGAVLGLATLVRPQCLVLAPLFGLVAASPGSPRSRRALLAVVATAAALGVCAPWTARNCVRMKQCALVSVNGGWNLLIGADAESTGSWAPIKVPEACKEVFDEAGKDACFARAGRRYIADHPAAWLALVPRKLEATFDYSGAAGWYLHAANPEAFGDRAKVVLGSAETIFERLSLLLALVWVARGARAPRGGEASPGAAPPPVSRRLPVAVALVGAVFALTLHAWVGYLALGVGALLRVGRRGAGAVLPSTAAATLLATMATHAVFFGSGRYSLVVFPLVCGLAALGLARPRGAEPAASFRAPLGP